MSSGTSQMSVWIKFFSDAGIPAGVSANYAVLFTEHRIQQDMLLELNKEYLSEMGITVLGDVIAILRHAKNVHAQLTKEKALQQSVKESSPPKRSTPASRTVNHYLGVSPNQEPVNEPTVPKISIELANRLGSCPTSATGITKTVCLRSSKEEVPVPKIRRVLPEHEGKYKIIMPKGTTEKTKKILSKKLSGQSDTEDSKVTITGIGKVIVRNTSSKPQGSVFNRLGNISTIKRPASSTCPDSDDSDDEPLPYAGVLKQTPKSTKLQLVKKKTPIAKRIKIEIEKDKGAEGTEIVTSTEGILASSGSLGKKPARARLGTSTLSTTTAATVSNITITKSKDLGTRLTTKKTAVAATTTEKTPPKKILLKRQVTPDTKSQVVQTRSTTKNLIKPNVFSRLGKPAST